MHKEGQKNASVLAETKITRQNSRKLDLITQIGAFP